MRVLLHGRSVRSTASSGGGDVVQLLRTAEALRSRGVDAEVSQELTPSLDDYDAVHLFNIVRPQEAWTQARNAVAQNKCIFLSTVYCTVWEYDQLARTGPLGFFARHSSLDLIEGVKSAARALVCAEVHRGLIPLYTKGYSALQKDILRWSDVLLPNSRSEMARLTRDLGVAVPEDRVLVVPNGIDRAFYDPFRLELADCPAHLERYRGCVLCVARIGGPKNQLTLVRAARDLPLDVVVVGRAGPMQRRYWGRLERESGRNVHLLGPVSEDDKWWLYRLARVHVLPSWIETTGLSSLEAAAMGCSLVITEKGDTREYFEDFAEYCDPGDSVSVRQAILRAYEQLPSSGLRQKIVNKLTWDHAADATIAAYAYGLRRHAEQMVDAGSGGPPPGRRRRL